MNTLKISVPTRSWEYIEKTAVFILLILFPRGISYPPGIDKLINALSYLIIAFLFCRHWKKIAYVGSKDLLLILLTILGVASVIWSAAPAATLELVRGLISVTILAMYVAATYPPQEQVNLLGKMILIWGIVSIILIAIPGYGIAPFKGVFNWVGIFGWKYTFGAVMSLGTMLSLTATITQQKNRYLLLLLACISFILLFQSQSRTSLFAFLCALAPLPVYLLSRQKLNYRLKIVIYIVGLVLSLSCIAIFLFNIVTIFEWFGKDLTFSGRLPLWDGLIRQGLERPWLGYGQGAFWHTENSIDVINAVGYPRLPSTGSFPTTYYSHNGFIELFLNVGIIGFGLFILNFLWVLSRVLYLIVATGTVESYLMIQFLIFLVAANCTEAGSLLAPNNLFWGIYLVIAFSSAIKIESLHKKKKALKYCSI